MFEAHAALTPISPAADPFASLRKFARPRRPAEQCDLCGNAIAPKHPHVLETTTKRLVCSCDACAILFDGSRQGPPGGARYRRVPDLVQYLRDYRMSDVQWNGMAIPISLAFFICESASGRVVAMYPSPAGAVESQLTLDLWEELAGDNPVLRELQPDVEALLVNRIGETREHWRVPIDECYMLVGIIRAQWRGLSGGTEVWKAGGGFFDDLRLRCADAGDARG